MLLKNIIELLYTYLSRSASDAFRQCSKYINLIIGPLYFSKTLFNADKIKFDRELFRSLVYKYKLKINIINIKNDYELSYFSTYDVMSIKFAFKYNSQYYKYFLPKSLKSITFENMFSQSINDLPENIKSITMNGMFNSCLDSLPIHLESLVFESFTNFDQPIHTLPTTLKKLVFNNTFDSPIDEFPPNLEIMSFGEYFNQVVLHKLPSTLKKLSFGVYYNEIINQNQLATLFPELQEFKMNNCMQNIDDDFIIKHEYTSFVGIFPSTLQTLTWHIDKPIQPNVIPSLLKVLILGDRYNSPISPKILPETLQKLIFGYNYNTQIEENVLPTSLKILQFGSCYNKPILKNTLPLSLEELYFGFSFNQLIEEKVLSESITDLRFGYNYNKPIEENVLPPKLKHLFLNYHFKQSIKEFILPPLLESLTVGPFIKNLSWNILPLSLVKLSFMDEEMMEDYQYMPEQYKHVIINNVIN
jgi:hypothetical protein